MDGLIERQEQGASAEADRAGVPSGLSRDASQAKPLIPCADYAGEDFQRGAQAMREMLARFVEQGGDAVTAGSLRANWHPGWNDDPGPPPNVIDTWEAPECPEGEALYAEWAASTERAGAAGEEEPLFEALGSTIAMLERWAIPMLPANRLGQIPFMRGLLECALRDLRRARTNIGMRERGFIPASILDAVDAAHPTPQESS